MKCIEFELLLERKYSLNAYQNSRKIRLETFAKNEDEARLIAELRHPEFKVSSVRKKS